MNEFQAAMGICNLRYVDEEIAKRKLVVEKYIENLGEIEGIKLVKQQQGVRSNYSYFPVVFDGYMKTRNEVYEELKEHHIIARKYFYPLTNTLKCYDGKFESEETPIARYIADRVLTLPLYSDLDIKDVDRICEIIKR
jgi:dTDP-4-amino-4,6-dideoxygalactose transaminase